MERPIKRRGISLSHHFRHQQIQSQLKQNKSRRIQLKPSAAHSKQPRCSSLRKPKFIFSYSAQKAQKISQNKSLSRNIMTRALQPYIKQASIAQPNLVNEQLKSIYSNGQSTSQKNIFEKIVYKETESTQTQTNKILSINQKVTRQHYSNRQAFAKRQYGNRKRQLQISSKVINYQPDSAFFNIQIKLATKEQQNKKKKQKEGNQKPSQYYKSLQSMQKRLMEIIQICDKR